MLGDVFAEFGYDVDTFAVVGRDQVEQPAITVRFPDPLDYDVVVPLGARWAVYDERLKQSWVADEMALVRTADAAGVGVLGVCFGGQLVAQAFGGSVERSTDPEIGWHEVSTDAPDLIPAGPWFQWHFDRCVLPPGAEEVARNEVCVQAFETAHGLGVQFHPEITTAMVGGWIEAGGAEQCVRHGVDPGELLERSRAMEPMARANARRLVDGFLGRTAYRAG